MIFNKRNHNSKKGFTLIELIVVLALSVMVVGAASISLINGSNSYYKTRSLSQAVNLSNDLIEGLTKEIESAFFGKLARGSGIITNSANSATFSWANYDSKYYERPYYDSPENPPSGNSIIIEYQFLIYVDKTNNTDYGGKIMCQSKTSTVHNCHFGDSGTSFQIPSKYYDNLKIANLQFEKVVNTSYGSKFNGNLVVNSVVINRNVENILRISFEVRNKSNDKLIYKLENYSILLNNVMTNIGTEFNSKYINYNTLRLATQNNGTYTDNNYYEYFLFTKTPCE